MVFSRCIISTQCFLVDPSPCWWAHWGLSEHQLLLFPKSEARGLTSCYPSQYGQFTFQTYRGSESVSKRRDNQRHEKMWHRTEGRARSASEPTSARWQFWLINMTLQQQFVTCGDDVSGTRTSWLVVSAGLLHVSCDWHYSPDEARTAISKVSLTHPTPRVVRDFPDPSFWCFMVWHHLKPIR